MAAIAAAKSAGLDSSFCKKGQSFRQTGSSLGCFALEEPLKVEVAAIVAEVLGCFSEPRLNSLFAANSTKHCLSKQARIEQLAWFGLDSSLC